MIPNAVAACANNGVQVLCDYEELVIRADMMVLVKDTAPVCCCPPLYTGSLTTEIHAYLCPRNGDDRGTATCSFAIAFPCHLTAGPFATPIDTLTEYMTDESSIFDFPPCPGEYGYGRCTNRSYCAPLQAPQTTSID
jgi:hypothetical protein